MADSRHEAVWDWLTACPLIQDLFFNFAQGEPDSTQLIPSERIIEEYIDGSSLRRYDVELARFLPISFEPNDTGNIDMLLDVEALADWVAAQDDAGNLPEFPAGETVLEISVVPSASGFAAAQDGIRARYVIPFQIEYRKEARTNG